jgi:hypothetical protein
LGADANRLIAGRRSSDPRDAIEFKSFEYQQRSVGQRGEATSLLVWKNTFLILPRLGIFLFDIIAVNACANQLDTSAAL